MFIAVPHTYVKMRTYKTSEDITIKYHCLSHKVLAFTTRKKKIPLARVSVDLKDNCVYTKWHFFVDFLVFFVIFYLKKGYALIRRFDSLLWCCEKLCIWNDTSGHWNIFGESPVGHSLKISWSWQFGFYDL